MAGVPGDPCATGEREGCTVNTTKASAGLGRKRRRPVASPPVKTPREKLLDKLKSWWEVLKFFKRGGIH